MNVRSQALAIPAAGDLVALTKPGILSFALLTCAAGMSLAPGYAGPEVWLPLLLGTGMLVGSANALNMYLEREVDCLMARTRNRPLPAKRMEPIWALGFGVLLAAISVPLLSFAVNPLTGFLGVVALVSYVLWYTPLKQRTSLAAFVGGIPGAMPPLLGWTAVTGGLELGGLAIFGIMFLWQIPHFHAIALFRRKEYARAGLKTLPGERGPAVTRLSILLYSLAQVQLSLMLYPLGVAGRVYLIAAALLGLVTIVYVAAGARSGGPRWGRRVFLMSIIYLPLLFIAMVLDGVA